jgi:hypothetical protein
MSPQRLDLDRLEKQTTVFFRSKEERGKTTIRFTINGKDIFSKQYNQLRPPEMERISLHLSDAELQNGGTINAIMEER